MYILYNTAHYTDTQYRILQYSIVQYSTYSILGLQYSTYSTVHYTYSTCSTVQILYITVHTLQYTQASAYTEGRGHVCWHEISTEQAHWQSHYTTLGHNTTAVLSKQHTCCTNTYILGRCTCTCMYEAQAVRDEKCQVVERSSAT